MLEKVMQSFCEEHSLTLLDAPGMFCRCKIHRTFLGRSWTLLLLLMGRVRRAWIVWSFRALLLLLLLRKRHLLDGVSAGAGATRRAWDVTALLLQIR